MVEIRPIKSDETNAALALILDQAALPPAELRDQVQAFLTYMQDRAMPLDAQYVAVADGSIVAAAVRLDSPGRTALLFAPSMRLYPQQRDVVIELLDRLIEAGRRRGMRIFQALAPPDSVEDGSLFAAAGFERLAELVYLERLSTLPVDPGCCPSGLVWTCYEERTHELFCQVIQATYERSLDCPRLSGLRDIEDIIAAHKDAGEFDPKRWFIVSQHGKPAGCLLLARIRHRPGLELVYMGLRPQARGRGLARAMVHRAIRVALGAGLAYVRLAVDAQNTPAYSLYRRFGFTETMRRTAWVITPEKSE